MEKGKFQFFREKTKEREQDIDVWTEKWVHLGVVYNVNI